MKTIVPLSNAKILSVCSFARSTVHIIIFMRGVKGLKYNGYNERRERGRLDFPIEYHYVTSRHLRYNMPYHWHVEYEIIRLIRGNIHFTLNEKTFWASAGDILFVADGIVHGCFTEGDDCIYECAVFELRAANGSCREKIRKILNHEIVIIDHFSQKDSQIQAVVSMFFESLKQKTPGYELLLQGALYQFLGLIFAQNLYKSAPNAASMRGNRRHIAQLKRAFHLIETSYFEPLTLRELAAASGLSPKYFCRFFKDMTQRTPIDYLNYYRIECACDKLTTEDKTALEIAYACGFNDFSYFIKTFRKYKNTTPNKFLSAYKEANAEQNSELQRRP